MSVLYVNITAELDGLANNRGNFLQTRFFFVNLITYKDTQYFYYYMRLKKNKDIFMFFIKS